MNIMKTGAGTTEGVATQRATRWLAQHSIETRVAADGSLQALAHYTQDGIPGSEWETVATDLQSLRNWMGY